MAGEAQLTIPRELLGTLEGFMLNVDRQDSCWLWEGNLNNKGYGSFYSTEQKKNIGAHRASVLLHGRIIPAGKVVDHLCHVRNCVNPDHLRVATYGQNNENRKGLSSSRSGHRNVKVTSSGNYQARLKKHGVEYYMPVTHSLEVAVEQAKVLRMEHFTHNTLERN